MQEADVKLLEQLKEIFQRITALEQDIKRHEQIAWVVFVLLTGIGILSFKSVGQWIKNYMRLQIAEKMGPTISEAQTLLTDMRGKQQDELQKIGKLRDEAGIYHSLIKKYAATAPGAQEFQIQTGENEVTFTDATYMNLEVIFP